MQRLAQKVSRVLHRGQAFSVAFSSDSQYVATAGADGVVRVSEVSAPTLAVFALIDRLLPIEFSPRGRTLGVVAGGGTLSVFDTVARQGVVAIAHDREINRVTFSRDGRFVATMTGFSSVDAFARRRRAPTCYMCRTSKIPQWRSGSTLLTPGFVEGAAEQIQFRL